MASDIDSEAHPEPAEGTEHPLGDQFIIIGRLGDPSSNNITIQDFVRDGESFIPLFSDLDHFRLAVKGTEFENQGLEIKRALLLSMLRGDELLILDPGSPDARPLRKSDLQ